jgi:hypothetical protein
VTSEEKVKIDEERQSEGGLKSDKCRGRSREVCVTNQEKRE